MDHTGGPIRDGLIACATFTAQKLLGVAHLMKTRPTPNAGLGRTQPRAWRSY